MTLQTPFLLAPPGPDQRMAEILDAVRDTFVEKGFDGASMQDLARAAGISVGNFYRYFQSKDAMVEAIVMRDLADVEREFAAIIRSDDPLAALRAVLSDHIHGTCGSDCGLWAEITAAARRKPRIGAVMRRLEAGIHGYITTVFATVTALPPAEAARRYGGHASIIMMLVKAGGMRIDVPEAAQTDLNAQIMRTIDWTLDEIETDRAKG